MKNQKGVKRTAPGRKRAGTGRAKVATVEPVVVELENVEQIEPAAKPNRRTWPWVLVVSTVVVLAVVSWIVGNLFFSRISLGAQTLPASTSNAVLVSKLNQAVRSYRLGVAYPDKTVQWFSLSNVGVHADTTATVAALRARERSPLHMLWWWRPVTVDIQGSVDTVALATFAAQHVRITKLPASDARLAIVNGAVQITHAKNGMAYTLPNATATIATTARALQPAPLHLQLQTVLPTVAETQLTHTKNTLDAVLSQKITLHIGDDTVAPASSDIASWLTIVPDATTKLPMVGLDADKLRSYLQGIAASHALAAKSQVVDASGKILTAGKRGVAAPDITNAYSQLSMGVLQHAGADITLPAQYTAFKVIVAPTNGKWIEVNLTTKTMYAYDQTGLLRSFLVTAGASATPTVVGRFAIYAKYRSQDMFGENTDGSRYYQPSVPYVNYFYADYAIHGNYWRPSSYFGFINSSHGCVGLPVDDSAWVYGWAPVGTPVIVHT